MEAFKIPLSFGNQDIRLIQCRFCFRTDPGDICTSDIRTIGNDLTAGIDAHLQRILHGGIIQHRLTTYDDSAFHIREFFRNDFQQELI